MTSHIIEIELISLVCGVLGSDKKNDQPNKRKICKAHSHLLEKEMQMAFKHMTRHSTLLIIRDIFVLKSNEIPF